jgi:CheY-like chemotaxis protein
MRHAAITLLLLAAAAARGASARRIAAEPCAAACASDLDCSLNGVCDVASGACACDAAWTGACCTRLALLPVEPDAAGYRHAATSTWGGNILADPGSMGQLLMNMAANARDAMPDGGRLTIATSRVTLDEYSTHVYPGSLPGDYILLSVSDTGTGMSEEVKAQIFEAFFTTKPVGKGTGLGLANCKTIIQQSDGCMSVFSELGKGTTFQILFPCVDQPLELAAQSVPSAPLARGTETLLVVEDDPAVRRFAVEALQNQGYNVLSAVNGKDGINMARTHQGPPIQLVVTDVIMPLIGGRVMAECLKMTCPEVKVLFTSGYTDDTISNHGVLEADMDFLPKPHTQATLTRKVREMLDA